MALQLTGSKTLQIAGTPLQCVEIYTGEAYLLPFQFTSAGSPINITNWVFNLTAHWYSITGDLTNNNITINQIDDLSGTYPSGPVTDLAAVGIVGSAGTGYLQVPIGITPTGYSFNLSANPVLLALVTMQVTRPAVVGSFQQINKEPLGFLIRYQ